MTALTHVTKVFSIVDAKIAQQTDDTTGGSPTYGSVIDIPGIQKMGVSFNMTSTQLSGDNVLLESDTVMVGAKLTFDHAKLSFDALAVLLGGTVTDNAAGGFATPNRNVTYVRAGTDSLPYFKLEGATPTSGVAVVGGNLVLSFFKCKITDYNLGFAEEDYQIFSASADAVFTTTSNQLFGLVFNETAAAITV